MAALPPVMFIPYKASYQLQVQMMMPKEVHLLTYTLAAILALVLTGTHAP
jgi:hypothetical protein